MKFEGLLVVIPHSGIVVPGEIPLDSLADDFPKMMKNVDWYTNWLYDFRDILHNTQLSFPFCSLILEANRHPSNLDESVPLKDTSGKLLYRPGLEPTVKLRNTLSKKYLHTFHLNLRSEIARGKVFMLDAHSTITAKGVSESQIELMNYQVSGQEGSRHYFCPDAVIETYANELAKRLQRIKVTVNESRYDKVYGHVCGTHSTNSLRRKGNRIPAILQEINQKLYMDPDGTPNLEASETIRRACAEALYLMARKVLIHR